MLTELCAELRNYFEVPNGRHFGKFEISGGSIAPLDFLQEGQYFRIVGSVFNDGVYQYPATSLTDEVFDGAVWAMAVPPTLIALSAEIEEYNKSDAGKASLILLKVLAVTATQRQPMQTVRLLAGRKHLQAVYQNGGNYNVAVNASNGRCCNA